MTYCFNCGKELTEGAAFCANCGAPVQAAASAQQAPISGFDALAKERAAREYWIRRLIAFAIDALVVFVVLVVIAAIISIPQFLLSGYTPGKLPISWLAAGSFSIFFSLFFVLYFTLAEGTGGTSLGKQILGLRVRTTRGTNPTVGEAFIRNISKIYWALLFLDVVVGLAISRDYKEKFSDRYAHTSVVAR